MIYIKLGYLKGDIIGKVNAFYGLNKKRCKHITF